MKPDDKECNKEPNPDEKRQRLTSFLIMDYIMFALSLHFSIYFASLWPYMSLVGLLLKSIDPEATEEFFGWVVAMFSLGQIIASPLFGLYSSRRNTVRTPCIIAAVVAICGNLLYISVSELPSGRRHAIAGSRLIMGFSAGVNGCCRAYIATKSFGANRDRAIAIATAAMTMTGPVSVIQAAVSFVGYPGHWVGPIRFDMYTLPSMILIICCVIGIVLNQDRFNVIPKFNRLAFVQKNVELGSPFAMIMFNWTHSETTFYTSLMMGCSAVLQLLMLFILRCYQITVFRVEKRASIIFGLSIQLLFLTSSLFHHNPAKLVGCPNDFRWCEWTPPIPQILYISSFPLLFLGIPPVNVALSTLYSNVLGPRPQIIWLVNAAILISSILVIVVKYGIMVPLVVKPTLKSGQSFAFKNGIVWHF
ncbi:unnamed protein product [Soboliphyme baturini]|uniref:MFS domain-containing protein n=1 Tax=Soboliphyme baturini TaxID=241478 RepID=A0A183IFA0_9BILA|nr:unnamed protein product [Soboliphyme baturini]